MSHGVHLRGVRRAAAKTAAGLRQIDVVYSQSLGLDYDVSMVTFQTFSTTRIGM